MRKPAPADDIDAAILHLASRQQGVVSRAQLTAAGIAGHRIDYRRKRGRLVTLHHGVYAVGRPGPRAREAAAILACGPTAAISHRTAACLHDQIPPRPRSATIDISLRSGNRRPASGIRIYRPVELLEAEITPLQGLTVTTAARTLLDLATVAGARELERAVARTLRSELSTAEDLERLLAAHAGHTGVRLLRAVLGVPGGPALTRSRAEELLLELIRSAGLPTPKTNAVVKGYEVDFAWHRQRVIAEVDGYTYHRSKQAFERDRRRDNALAAAGWTVVRVTWDRLTEAPHAVVAELAQALALGARAR